MVEGMDERLNDRDDECRLLVVREKLLLVEGSEDGLFVDECV